MKKWLLGKSDRADKASYFWNMIASGINASEAIVVLIVANRTIGLEYAGIYTIAFSIANILMCLGKYNVRTFQVTDANNEYSFGEFLYARKLSMTFMGAGTALYLIVSYFLRGYSFYKVSIVFAVIFLYSLEAVEDVYLAQTQKQGRLDIGTRMFSVRWFITLLVWCVCLIVTREALLSVVIAAVADLLMLVWLIFIVKSTVLKAGLSGSHTNRGHAISLMGKCFPLCVASMLSIYLPNAAKYAIDSHMSDTEQAYYGFISMPIFVIDLLAMVVFQPVVKQMAEEWVNRNIIRFRSRAAKMCLILAAISVVVLMIGYAIGIPVLSFIYGVGLEQYKTEFMILLIGGIAVGYMGLAVTVLTIMRKQKYIMLSYVVVSVVALFSLNRAVIGYGLPGAAAVNCIVLWVLAVILSAKACVETVRCKNT